MAKTHVVDPSDGTRVPFLRGILVRSLHDAGLGFEEAYEVAGRIRQELEGVDEITTGHLHQKVLELLQKSFDQKIADAYQPSSRAEALVMVVDADGQVSPFARSQHIHCLQSTGLTADQARSASRRVLEHLLENNVTEISSARLGHLTYICLHRHLGADAARRYLVWEDYCHSDRPLILLLGGTTGCGKSTVATEVAHRLGVVRTQSTDMLREVMRQLLPKRLLPVLHTSAFDAWTALPFKLTGQDQESLIADGYRSQMELLSVPCEAVLQRALKERVSLILEGVHVHPSLLSYIDRREDAVIVPILLAVLKKEKLKKRLQRRGKQAPERGGKRYLASFDRIWELQTYLLSEADEHGIPIITNDDREKTTVEIMGTIIDVMAEGFSSTPAEVFGDG
ncbi:MAG TPA: hypothetical protein ENI96_09400 [Sedimenticola thiotaurini]|uniref:ATP-cone domain-containing protein n=1 Tax=Sedimenticola thiotaurini TaxID=1543721 RepID=A0A831RPI1_9GAMM|nr:hypothetical protein [Sedimenticola thiotaurini]